MYLSHVRVLHPLRLQDNLQDNQEEFKEAKRIVTPKDPGIIASSSVAVACSVDWVVTHIQQ